MLLLFLIPSYDFVDWFLSTLCLLYNLGKYIFFTFTGPSTVFGLHDTLKSKWNNEAKNEMPDFQSTYNSSFKTHSNDAFVRKHFATKKELSSHFHPHRVNKNLPLRNTNVNIAPEFPPIVSK